MEKLLIQLDAALKELSDSLSPEQQEKFLEYLLDVYAAISAIRTAGFALTPALLKALSDAMAALFGFLKYLGEDSLSLIFRRLLSIALRFAQGLAGGAEAAAGFVLIDMLILAVGLVLWAWLWVEIGNWFWTRPIDGKGETYVDFWGKKIADLRDLFRDTGCEERLARWIEADRELRRLEAAGANLGEKLNVSITASVLAELLVRDCPELSIKNVLLKRIRHYTNIRIAFDKMVTPP